MENPLLFAAKWLGFWVGLRFCLVNVFFSGGTYDKSTEHFEELNAEKLNKLSASFELWTTIADRFFGTRIISVRAFCMSFLLTVVFSTLFFLLSLILIDIRQAGFFGSAEVVILEELFEIFINFYFFTDAEIYPGALSIYPKVLLLYMLFFSSIIDYISVSTTRLIVKRIALQSRFSVIVFYLILDVVLSTLIFVYGSIVLHSFYVIEPIGSMITGRSDEYLDRGFWDFFFSQTTYAILWDGPVYLYWIYVHIVNFPAVYIFTTFGFVPFMLLPDGSMTIATINPYYPFTTFLAPTYLTSIWLWMTLAAVLLIRMNILIGSSVDAHRRMVRVRRSAFWCISQGTLWIGLLGTAAIFISYISVHR